MKLIEFVVTKLSKDTMITVIPENRYMFPAELYQGEADKCPLELGNTEVDGVSWLFADDDLPEDDILITVKVSKEQLDRICLACIGKGKGDTE